MTSHLDLERTVGGHAAAARVERDPHAAVAALLNCAAGEIALAESAQAGWARAFYRSPSGRTTASSRGE